MKHDFGEKKKNCNNSNVADLHGANRLKPAILTTLNPTWVGIRKLIQYFHAY